MNLNLTENERLEYNLAYLHALMDRNRDRIRTHQRLFDEIPSVYDIRDSRRWSDASPMPTRVVKEMSMLKSFNNVLEAVNKQMLLQKIESTEGKKPIEWAKLTFELQEQVTNMKTVDDVKATKMLTDLEDQLLGEILPFQTAIGWTKVNQSIKKDHNYELLF